MGAASKVVDTVTDTVDNVVKAIDNTVQSALDDPVNTAIRVGATVVGGPAGLAAANAAISLGQGNDLGTALEQGAKGYALSTLGNMAGAEVAGETGSDLAGQVTSGATKAALGGGDPLSGAVSGGLSSVTGDAAKSISDQNFTDWAKEQAANTYDNAPSPTEQDVLDAMQRETTGTPLSDVSDALPTSTTPPEAYDPAATTGQIKGGLNYVANAALNPTSALGAGLGLTAGNAAQQATGTQQATAPLSAADFTPKFLDTSPRYLETKMVSGNEPHMQELKQLYGNLAHESSNSDSPLYMADGGSTNSLNAIADSLNPTSQNLGFTKPYSPNLLPAAPLMQNQMKINPLRHLHESLISRQRTAGGLAEGGLPQKYAEAMPKGHKPEFITGLTGYYASGKGTGQSDEIDAMLHDGDYVADADLVAALGDGSSKAGAEALEKFRRQVPHNERAVGGSAVPAKIADGEYVFPASFVTAIGQGDNKAGAKILDKMREAIRAHKRSAPTTKIPPKALSPLEYLKRVQSDKKP